MRKFFPTGVNPLGVFAVLFLTVSLGVAALVVSNRGLDFNIGEKAAAPLDESLCSGCAGDGFEWSWNKKAEVCKKKASSACGKKAQQEKENPDSCENKGGHCVTGISRCFESGGTDHEGNCNKGVCCAGGAAGKLVQTEDPNSCETSGGQCLASCTNTGLVNTAGNCIKQGTYCCKPRVPDIVPQAGSESSDEEEETSSESNSVALSTEIQVCRLEGGIWQSGKCIYPGQSSSQVVQGGGGQPLLSPANPAPNKKTNNSSCTSNNDCQSGNCTSVPGGRVCQPEGVSFTNIKVPQGQRCGTTAYDRQCEDGSVCVSNKCQVKETVPTVASGSCLETGKVCEGGRGYSDSGGCGGLGIRCGQNPKLAQSTPTIPTSPINTDAPEAENEDPFEKCANSNNAGLCLQRAIKAVQQQLASPTNTTQNPSQNTSETIPSLTPDVPSQEREILIGPRKCSVCQSSGNCRDYTGGDVLIGASYTIFECNGQTGQLENRTDDGYTFADVTVTSGITESDLTAQLVNLNTFNQGRENTPQAGCGGSGGSIIPSGNVALGSGDERQRCNNGRWEPCPGCALTVVPLYLYNDPEFLQEQISRQENYQEVQNQYYTNIQSCLGTEGENELTCHAEALAQFDPNLISQDLIDALDQNFEQGQVLQNAYYPTLEKLNICLSENNNSYAACAGYQHELNRIFASSGLSLANKDFFDSEEGGFGNYITNKVASTYIEARQEYEQCQNEANLANAVNPNCVNPSAILLHPGLPEGESERIIARFDFFQPNLDLCAGKPVCNPFSERYTLLSEAGYSVEEIEAMEKQYRDYLNQIALSGDTGLLQLCGLVATSADQQARCSNDPTYLKNVVLANADPRLQNEFNQELDELTNNLEIQTMLYTGSSQDLIAACKNLYSGIAQAGERRYWCSYPETAKQALLNSLPETFKPQAITAQGSGGRTTVLLAGQAGCNSQGQCVAAVANADGASVSDETQSLTGSYALSCPTSCSLIGANSKPTTSEGFNQGDTVVTRCLDNKTVQTTTTSALAPDGFTYETSCGAGICSQGQCRQATVVVDKATGTPKFCEVGQQSCGTLIDEFGVPYEAIIVQTEDGKLRQQITSNNDAYNAAAEAYFLEHNGEALANFNEGYEVYIDREGAVINIPPEILDHAKYRLFVQENPGSTLADFQNYKLDEYDQYIKDELDVNFFESIGNFFSSQQEKQAAEDLRIFLAEQNQFIRQGIAAGDINLDFLKVGFSQAADQLQQNPLAFTDVIRDSVNLSLTPEQFEAVLANQRKIYNTNNYPDFGQRLLGGGEPTVEDLLAQQSQQFNDALYVYDAFNPHVFTEEELRQLEDPNSALSIQVARNERLSILVDKLGGATSSTLLSALTGEQNYSQLRDQYEGNAILREIIDLNREIDGQFLRSELTKEIGADKIASGDWLGGYWDMAMGNTTQFLTGGLKTGVTGLTGIVAVAGCVGTAGVGCLVAAAGTTLAVNGSLNAASEVSTACVGDTTNCGTSLINLGINIAFTRAASLGLRGARVASTVAQTEITAANLARREILEQTGRELVGKGLADDAFNISQSLVRQSPNLIDQLAINTTRYGAPAWFGYQGVNCLTTEGTNKLDCTLMLAQAAVSTLTWSRAYQQGTGQIVQNRLDFGINSAQALVSCAGSLSTGNYDVCTQSLANAGVSAGQLHQSIGDIYQGQGVGAEDTALVGLLDAQKLVDNLYNPDGTPKKDTNPQQRIEADNALKLAIQSHAQEQIYLLQALKNVEGNENSWTIVQKKLIDVQKAYLDAQANYDILLKGKTPAEVVNTAEFTAYEKARQLLKNTYQTLVLEQYALAAPKGKSPDEAVQTEYETAFREFEEISKKLSPAETAYQEAYQRLLNAREALDSSLLQPTQREIQEAVSARTAEAAELEAQISLAERELTALKDSQSAEAYRQELIDKIAGAQAKGAQEEANSLSPMLARAEEIVRLVQNGGDPLTQAVSEHLILIKTLSENVVALGAEMTTLTQAKEQAGKPLARIMERLGRTPTADQVAGEVQRPARPSEQTPPRRSVREILLGSDNSPTLLGNLARRLGGNPQQEVGLGALAQKFPNLQEALSQTPDVKTFIQGEGNIFRLKAPDGASPEVVSEISRFNNILEKFESDFGNPAYDTQVEKLALAVKDNKILIQLEAGGGKTQVLAPITAALEGNSIVHLATKTDALDVVKQFSARQAFFESAFSDFKVYYFDSTRGFLAIDPAKTFDIENARTVSAQTVRRAMEAAKQNPLQAGVAIITQTSELAWGTVRGRTSGAGDVDKVLFEMVNKNFSLVGDEAGVTAGSRFSVSFGNEEVLSRLTNPKLLAGVENGQRLLELSAGVEKLSSLAEFRQQILNTLSRKGDHRANFVQIERNGNVYSTWIPADQQVIRDSYAEIIQNTLRTLPNEASLLKGELDNLLTLARNGDIESLNKGFSDLLQRTNLTTSTDRLVLAELAYQRADLHARWEVLYKIPGNDFGQESGLIVLRKVGETTGEQFQEVARKIALQEEGANMLRAAGIGVEDTAPLVSVGNLTLAPDSSSITMSELYQYSDRTILFDATPLTAEAQLGIASAGLPESAPKPKEFFIDPNIQTLADKGLALIPENKGLAVVMNAEGSSFDQGTNIIIQKRRPEYVAVTRYTRRANGEILPQYYLEKIAYNPDGSIIRNPIGRIDDLDGWNAAIQELLPTLQGPQELLIVFEGRNRAVDLKVKNGLHQNFEWAQIADPQNNGEGLLQGVRRNRVLAETGDAATWSPELIAEHSGYHLWVLGDPNVLKLGGSNLNADNVVAYFDQRTQLDIVKLKTENLIANLSKNSESLLESVRSSLLENRPSGISEEQIRSVMDDIASDARRVSLARTSDLSTTPLTGETIANDVYLQGLSAHEQRLNYLNEIQGRLNLPESTFAQIRSQLGVENSYPDKVVFDSALRGSPVAPEQIAESSAPGRIALEWAQENSIQTLDSLALFRQSLDEKTVVARAKSAETVTEKLAQAARQILAPTDVAVPLRNLGSSLTRLPASILAGLRNTLPNLGNTSQNVSQDISIEQAGLETAPANQGESPTSSLTVQRPQTQDLPAPLPAQPAENVQVSNPYIEIISGKPVLINLPSSGLTIEQAEKIEQELAKVGETIDSVAIAKTIETVKEEGGNDVQFVETSQAEVYVTANGLRSGAIGGTPDTFLIGFGQNTGGAVLSAQTGTTESISVNGRTIDIAKEQILLKSGDEVEFGTFRMRYEGLDSSQRGRFVLIDKVTNLAGLELEEVVATQDGAIIPRDPKFWSKQGLVNSFKNATPEKIFGRVRDVFFKDGKINPLRTAWQLARRINPVVVLGDVASVATNRWTITRVYIDQILINYLFDNLGLPHLPWFARPFIAYDTYRFFWQEGWRGVVPKDFQPQALAFAKEGLTLTKQALVRLDRLIAERAFLPKPTLTAEEKDIFLLRGVIDTNGTRSAVAVLASYLPRVEIKNLNGTTTIIHTKARQAYEAAEAGYRSGSIKPGEVVTNIPAPEIQPIPLSQSAWQGEKFGTVHGDNSEAAMDLVQSGLIAKGYPNELPVKIKIYVDDETFQDEVTTNVGVLAQSLKRIFAAEATRDKVVTIFLGSSEVFYGQIEHYAGSEPSREFAFLVQDDNVSKFSEDVVNNLRNEPNITRGTKADARKDLDILQKQWTSLERFLFSVLGRIPQKAPSPTAPQAPPGIDSNTYAITLRLMKNYGLTPDTIFYRVMDPQYLDPVNMRVPHNPASIALVRDNYHAVEHPITKYARENGIVLKEQLDPLGPKVSAQKVGPGLNVAVMDPSNYRKDGQVTISIRLADLLAVGGRIYRDEGAMASGIQPFYIVFDKDLPFQFVNLGIGEENKSEPEDYDAQILSLINSGAPGSLSGKTKNGTGFVFSSTGARHELTLIPILPVENKPEALFSPSIAESIEEISGRLNNIKIKVQGISYQAVSNQYAAEAKFRFDSHTAEAALEDNKRYKVYLFTNNSVLIYPGQHRIDLEETNVGVSESPLEKIHIGSEYDFEIWAPALATRMLLAGFPENMQVTFEGYTSNKETRSIYPGTLGTLARGDLSTMVTETLDERFVLPVTIDGKSHKFAVGDLIQLASGVDIIIVNIAKLNGTVDIRVLSPESEVSERRRFTLAGLEDYLNREGKPEVVRRYPAEKAIYYPSEYETSLVVTPEFESILKEERDFIGIYAKRPLEFSTIGDREFIWSDKETSHEELIKAHGLFSKEVPVKLNFSSNNKKLLVSGEALEIVRVLSFLAKHKNFEEISASFFNESGIYTTIDGSLEEVRSGVERTITERSLVTTNPNRALAMPINYYQAIAADWVRESALKGLLERLNIPNLFQIPQLPSGTTPESNTRSTSTNLSQPVSLESASLSSLVTLTETIISRFPLPLKNLGGFYDEDSLKRSVIRTASELEENGLVVVDETGSTPKTPSLFLAELKKMLNDEPLSSRIKSAERLEGIALSLYQLSAELEKNIASSEAQEAEQVAEEARITHEAYLRLQRRIFTVLALSQNLERASQMTCPAGRVAQSNGRVPCATGQSLTVISTEESKQVLRRKKASPAPRTS